MGNYILKTKRKIFNQFVEIRKRNKYDHNEEKTLTKKAQKYHAFTVKKSLFRVWQNWAHNEAKPLRLKKTASQRSLILCTII